MISKTFTYKDYDGNERTETFYFHLSKAELVTMEMAEPGGLRKKMENYLAAKDVPKIMEFFRDLIKRSYGEKANDGRRFVKSDDIFDAFSQTEAYSMLFMELITDDAAAEAFFTGIMPEDIQEEAKKNAEKIVDISNHSLDQKVIETTGSIKE